MTSRALRHGAWAARGPCAGGAGNSSSSSSSSLLILPSLNFGPPPLTQRSAAVPVTVRQKASPFQRQAWRSLQSACLSGKWHRDQGRGQAVSGTAASIPSPWGQGHQRHDGSAASASGASRLMRNYPNLLAKKEHGGISTGNVLPSLRRCFSFKARHLTREGKEGCEQPSGDVPGTPTSAARAIRKVLPKSLGALTPHENIYTVPNLLTFSRLIAAPFIGYAILHDAHAWALGLFVYAGVTDLLDGWIARRWNLQTVVGSVVDPMADKALMTILTVCLATKGLLPVKIDFPSLDEMAFLTPKYPCWVNIAANPAHSSAPKANPETFRLETPPRVRMFWLAVIILGRDVGLAIAAIYYRWISLPPPKTFTRYWDFSLPSAEVRPTTISKYNTFLQLALVGSTVVAPLVTGIEVGPALVGLQYIVATTTIWSGLSYVFSKDAVKILSDAKDKEQSKDEEEPKKP
ncbi:uncharacterized protein JN550_010008 [Neoarthrinium moseri]|uniref:uncharacterized protein n=1 Tax=Neoarthrinium moseri TaxID=1658444 RepID=UPI001FDDE91C|nr:uncharacterized protein JN550_010008 [Neoarthrinium moseri]KAI1862671.1 hypothetical protein JN550_010008 [Neoarthrinium moseri]